MEESRLRALAHISRRDYRYLKQRTAQTEARDELKLVDAQLSSVTDPMERMDAIVAFLKATGEIPRGTTAADVLHSFCNPHMAPAIGLLVFGKPGMDCRAVEAKMAAVKEMEEKSEYIRPHNWEAVMSEYDETVKWVEGFATKRGPQDPAVQAAAVLLSIQRAALENYRASKLTREDLRVISSISAGGMFQVACLPCKEAKPADKHLCLLACKAVQALLVSTNDYRRRAALLPPDLVDPDGHTHEKSLNLYKRLFAGMLSLAGLGMYHRNARGIEGATAHAKTAIARGLGGAARHLKSKFTDLTRS